MTNGFRNSAIALSLLGGVALMPIAASADSIHDNGDFGGSWNRIGPSHNYRTNYGYRNYGYRNYGYRNYGYRSYGITRRATTLRLFLCALRPMAMRSGPGIGNGGRAQHRDLLKVDPASIIPKSSTRQKHHPKSSRLFVR